ncbi:MAG: hypothetical protein SPI15_08055 [Candidatus Faecousia sp.]|nr:bifunctional adenosylcobinamide kinase/adenosylcobinamide-phosphate guanylyltransferase [Clostridiales bacterium]MDD6967219.1 bifunctional adenosylcobinamide kinase/adenosylcobinamide-phosphate guanylyltransferase [Bacillota bacterium]MDY6161215.1 hypothetical protein [Candidatus Faecousia sp.]MDY6180794.1 hypothetical protein [Candidatus Faecousia sp.]
MTLIIGGAYQGKLAFARETFGFGEEDVFTCSGAEIDFAKPCVNALEEFTLACVRQGLDPVEYLRGHRAQWENTVFICQDLFCGVVPIDTELRSWRHTTGLVCQYLSREADRVSRIFCGLEQRLK